MMVSDLIENFSKLSLTSLPSTYSNTTLKDHNLDDLYSDEVVDVDIPTMVKNLTELCERCKSGAVISMPFRLPRRRKGIGCFFVDKTRRYSYVKGSTSNLQPESVSSLSNLLRILIATLQAMETGDLVLPRSRRDVFYQFNNRGTIKISMPALTTRMDDLTNLYSCHLSSIGITAESGNSAFIGYVVVVRKDPSGAEVLVDASKLDQIYAINFSNISRVQTSDVAPIFLLIVEKLSVFRNLVSTKLHRKLPCVIITGSGQPSIECRRFVTLLHNTLRIPAFYIGDLNPYGYEIFKSYKYGSINLAHMSYNLVIPSLTFLGLLHTDITSDLEELMDMTSEDMHKAKEMQNDKWVSLEPGIQKSLSFNITNKRKSDIELLLAVEGITYLTQVFIPTKLKCFLDEQLLPSNVNN